MLRWYRDAFCYREKEKAKRVGKNPYEIIIDEMSEEIRDIFILPHFVGSGTPYLNSKSRGAILGLTLNTTKQNIARAVIDSINYEMKLNIDKMEEAGIKINEIRAIGGGAKSEKWLQMKADVFGKSVISLKVSEAASLGAAILAGKSIGIFKIIKETVKSFVKINKVYLPDKGKNEIYLEKYEKFKNIYGILEEFNRTIS